MATSQGDPARIKIYGKYGSALGYMIRDFLHRSDIPFEWVELTSNEQARELTGVSGLDDPRLPICVSSCAYSPTCWPSSPRDGNVQLQRPRPSQRSPQ
jgi:hypothetical protein